VAFSTDGKNGVVTVTPNLISMTLADYIITMANAVIQDLATTPNTNAGLYGTSYSFSLRYLTSHPTSAPTASPTSAPTSAPTHLTKHEDFTYSMLKFSG